MIQTNKNENALVEQLKSMSSSDAAAWLVKEFPITSPGYGRVFELIKRRSWKKIEQIQLCEYYMVKAPFASARPYEVFAQIMSAHAFLNVIKKIIPDRKDDLELLLYHLVPVLCTNFSNTSDKEAIQIFLSSFESGANGPGQIPP